LLLLTQMLNMTGNSSIEKELVGFRHLTLQAEGTFPGQRILESAHFLHIEHLGISRLQT